MKNISLGFTNFKYIDVMTHYYLTTQCILAAISEHSDTDVLAFFAMSRTVAMENIAHCASAGTK